MRTRLSFLFTAAAIAPLWSPPALAVPHVYTGFMLGIKSMEDCLNQAEKIGRNNGFTENIEIVGSGSMKDFHAGHNNDPISLSVSCSTKLGGAAIAVAGMNNDDTFAMFNRIYEAF